MPHASANGLAYIGLHEPLLTHSCRKPHFLHIMGESTLRGEVVVLPMIRLYGGECDGYGQKVSFNEAPETYYAVPLTEMEQIKKTVKSPLAKQVAIEKARRLCYTFKEVRVFEDTGMASGMEYCYERCAKQDKNQAKASDQPPSL